MKYVEGHSSENNFLINSMHKICCFHKCKEVIANDRLISNEKGQLGPLENNGSSPQNKQLTR